MEQNLISVAALCYTNGKCQYLSIVECIAQGGLLRSDFVLISRQGMSVNITGVTLL